MNRHLRLCGALSLFFVFPSLANAQVEGTDDIGAILKRLEVLEQQVTELRRQAGVQTAVETVARELRQRRPRFQKIHVAPPPMAGPGIPEKELPYMADKTKLDQIPQPVPNVVPPDRVAMRINGIEVKRQEIDEQVRFARSFVQGSDQTVIQHVLEREILPRCAAQSAASPEACAGIIQRAEELRGHIVDGGQDFASVATSSSQDESSAGSGGMLPPIERSAQPMAVAQAAFETAAGNVSPVVLSAQGAHFLFVEKKGKADPKDPASPLVVTARQVLLKWPTANTERPAPRIELLDPTLRSALPAGVTVIDASAEGDDMRASQLPVKQGAVDQVSDDGEVLPVAPKKGG